MPAPLLSRSQANSALNLGVKFSDLMTLPKEERRRQLLGRVQDVYDTALAKQGLGKAGPFDNPDCHSAAKCIELAARLTHVELDPGDGGGEEGKESGAAVDLAKAAVELEQKRKAQAA